MPRFGFTLDFAGYELNYRQASIFEALVNLKERGFSLKNLLDVSMEQLCEIKIKPELAPDGVMQVETVEPIEV